MDMLRIFAAYLIVVLHLSVFYITDVDINSWSWWLSNGFSALSRIGVPIFVMITGAFLLDEKKNIELKNIFCKYIFKAALIFLITSMFYVSIFFYKEGYFTSKFDIKLFLEMIVKGHYHLWYLYMIVGLYLLTPLFRAFVKNGKKSEILLFIIICGIVNSVTKYNTELFNIKLIDEIGSKMAIGTFTGYVGYYVAGWYFYNMKIKKRNTGIIYGLAIAAYILTVMATGKINVGTVDTGMNFVFYSNYSITTFFISIAVFLLFRRMNIKEKRLEKFEIHKYMFLVYLIHPFFIEKTKVMIKTNLFFSSLIIFSISLIMAVILRKLFYLCRIMKKTTFES